MLTRRKRVTIGAAAVAALLGTGLAMVEAGVKAASRTETGRAEIDAFNKKFVEAHRKMDNAAVMSLWAEDGVSLLPETAPMIGKKTIAKFLDDVTSRMPGYHMEKMDVDFRGIEVSGDWASEWAFEHQIVRPPDDKPVFDGHGKMLLVLHRESDGNWRIKREMWNQGLKDEMK